MLHLAFVSLFLAIANGASVLHHQLGGKIVGGVDTGIEDVPYQVAFELEGEQYCGGSIISPRHILSAAHCAYFRDVRDITVRVGATQRQTSGIVIQALTYTIHPDYIELGLENDVSIIELAEEITISNTSQIIPLTDEEPGPGTYVSTSGWGRLNYTSGPSDTLQSTNMIVVDHEVCKKIYDGYVTVTKHMFCAGDSRGICKGDSGGPVTKEVSGKRVLAGIVSWGRYGCAEADNPGVFVNVAHPDIKNFILEQIGHGYQLLD